MSCTLELAIQSSNTGQRIPLLKRVGTFGNNMDVHYGVKQILYMPGTPS